MPPWIYRVPAEESTRETKRDLPEGGMTESGISWIHLGVFDWGLVTVFCLCVCVYLEPPIFFVHSLSLSRHTRLFQLRRHRHRRTYAQTQTQTHGHEHADTDTQTQTHVGEFESKKAASQTSDTFPAAVSPPKNTISVPHPIPTHFVHTNSPVFIFKKFISKNQETIKVWKFP